MKYILFALLFLVLGQPVYAVDLAKCPVTRGRIEGKIIQHQSCLKANDCMLLQAGCSLGCDIPINKAAEHDIMKQVNIYSKTCDKECTAACVKKESEILCLKNKCVVKILEDELKRKAEAEKQFKINQAANEPNAVPDHDPRTFEEKMRDQGVLPEKTQKEFLVEELQKANSPGAEPILEYLKESMKPGESPFESVKPVEKMTAQ